MKIVIYTPLTDIINLFNKYSKTSGTAYKSAVVLQKASDEVITVRNEKSFFDLIEDDSIDGYAIQIPTPFSKKAIDFIKRRSPYTPVVMFGQMETLLDVLGADIYLPFVCGSDTEKSYKLLFDIIISNVNTYSRGFDKLKKLTTKMAETIQFGTCKYDPTKRTLYNNDHEVKKLSAKEGGILEILSSNYGQVVKREIILEKVWHKDDYFSGRSMDVYVTNLRKLFSKSKIKVTIKNISGVGLILE